VIFSFCFLERFGSRLSDLLSDLAEPLSRAGPALCDTLVLGCHRVLKGRL
jgi:hypothetical protein